MHKGTNLRACCGALKQTNQSGFCLQQLYE